MTTIAFDGVTMASDSLSVDSWGLPDSQVKMWENNYLVIGCAGEYGHICAWWRTLPPRTTIDDLLREGYPRYHKDDNNPSILAVDRGHKTVWKNSHGHFIPSTHKFHAIGSGMDYARTAMHLGKDARGAVTIAMLFDNSTGGEVTTITV